MAGELTPEQQDLVDLAGDAGQVAGGVAGAGAAGTAGAAGGSVAGEALGELLATLLLQQLGGARGGAPASASGGGGSGGSTTFGRAAFGQQPPPDDGVVYVLSETLRSYMLASWVAAGHSRQAPNVRATASALDADWAALGVHARALVALGLGSAGPLSRQTDVPYADVTGQLASWVRSTLATATDSECVLFCLSMTEIFSRPEARKFPTARERQRY